MSAQSWNFLLFKVHANGNLLPLTPHDEARYSTSSTDLAHSVRRQMVDALSGDGIDVEASHHEVAAGQSENRLSLRPGVDRSRFCHHFSDHPQGGSTEKRAALHLHAETDRRGRRVGHACAPEPAGAGLGRDGHVRPGERLWAGQNRVALHRRPELAHAPALTPLLAPLVNSYKRLVPGYEAPVYISWGAPTAAP
jgi:glutamine synthetase